ncbi:hypothetical protein MKW92_008290 [Papaver armeniacum]|nr:hypothetical protein MKW92_008290 [Papaver armeniacum]
MSYLLPHLHSGWAVDQAILSTRLLHTMYELYDPSTVMFFFRNKHIMIDLGTGNNNKINWALKDKQEFIDIIETVYRGARKVEVFVIAPKDYSTKYTLLDTAAQSLL